MGVVPFVVLISFSACAAAWVLRFNARVITQITLAQLARKLHMCSFHSQSVPLGKKYQLSAHKCSDFL